MATTKQATDTSKQATTPTRKQASTRKALASKRPTKPGKQATTPVVSASAYTYTVVRIPRVRKQPWEVVRPDGSKLPERFDSKQLAEGKARACSRERKQALAQGWQASEQPKRTGKQAPTGPHASKRTHDVHTDARATRSALWALVTDALRQGDADMPTYTLTLWASASARGHEHEASKRKIRTITGVRASDVAWAYKRVHTAMRETGLASEYSEMTLLPSNQASGHGKQAGHGHTQACADTLAYAHDALASKRA